jgi:4-oxalocrotonate tautomerase
MPYVNVQITKGATREQKAQLVKEITDSLATVMGKKPEHTHVVIQEIAEEGWGFSGLLTDEWKKAQGKAGAAFRSDSKALAEPKTALERQESA